MPLVQVGPPIMPPVASETPAGPPGLNAAPTLSGLMQALRRRLLLALGVAGLGATLAVFGVLMLVSAPYTVTSKLKLTSQAEPGVFFDRFTPPSDPNVWKLNQEGMLKSPLVLSRALNSDRLKNLGIPHDSIGWLETALKIDFLLGPEIMRVTLAGNDPEGLAPLLNAVIDAYLAQMDEGETGRRKDLLNTLEGTKRTFVEQLGQTEKELRTECERLKILEPESAKFAFQIAVSKHAAVDKDYRDLLSALGKKVRDLKSMQAREKNLDTEPMPAHLVEKQLDAAPSVQGLEKQREDVDAIIAGYKATLKLELQPEFLRGPLADRETLLRTIEGERARLRPRVEQKVRGEVRETLRNDLARLEGEIDGLKGQEKDLETLVRKLEEEVKRLDPASQPRSAVLEKLRADATQLNEGLRNLNSQIAKLKVEPPPSSRVVRLQTAEAPKSRDHSRQIKLAGAGGIGVFGILLFGVAFWEFRSRKITGAAEVVQGLGMNLLGVLPLLPPRLRRPGAGGKDETARQHQMNEAVDTIRTMLLHQARAEGLQVVMIASAVGGEGKTSVASQLAASLARAWRKTLLVDGDLRSPAVHKLFELPLEPGLSEVLRGEVNLGDAVKPTPLSRLWMMPAGQWDSHAVQALAQEGVGSLITQMKEQYEFIIVDSSPVLPVADALLLAQHVDAVVFSVLRDVSRLPAIHAAQQKLSALGVRSLGAIVIGGNGAGDVAYPYPSRTAG